MPRRKRAKELALLEKATVLAPEAIQEQKMREVLDKAQRDSENKNA